LFLRRIAPLSLDSSGLHGRQTCEAGGGRPRGREERACGYVSRSDACVTPPCPSHTPLTRPGSWSGVCTNAQEPKGGCPPSATMSDHGSAGRGREERVFGYCQSVRCACHPSPPLSHPAHPARELVRGLYQRAGAKRRLPHDYKCAGARICRARLNSGSEKREFGLVRGVRHTLGSAPLTPRSPGPGVGRGAAPTRRSQKEAAPYLQVCGSTDCRASWSVWSANRTLWHKLPLRCAPPAIRPRRRWAVVPWGMVLGPAPRAPEAGKPRGWWGAAANVTRFSNENSRVCGSLTLCPRLTHSPALAGLPVRGDCRRAYQLIRQPDRAAATGGGLY